MLYTKEEVLDYIAEDDVKFIRLAFCDIYGKQKNISIMPSELLRAFDCGIPFDASAIDGFEEPDKSDLLLFPDPETITVLPWRPSQGKVVRLFCDIKYPDKTPYEADGRHILKNAVKKAKDAGITCNIGAEFEFYLFRRDENGEMTNIPLDRGGYLDIAPADRGENIRRDICLTLEQMGIQPISSRHKEGPGQNEIDFVYRPPLAAADDATTFKSVVTTIAARNGAWASFMPKPLADSFGNGLHINISLTSADGKDRQPQFIAGIINRIREMTAFLNPVEESYKRLGEKKAPNTVSWSFDNRSRLIRIPASQDGVKRFELRSADPCANPYLTYALLISAGLEGIKNGETLPPQTEHEVSSKARTCKSARLPETLAEAIKEAKNSEFIKSALPKHVIDNF